MPWPSCSTSRSWMRVSHFWLAEPDQPGTSRRTGAPWTALSGSPFMANATSVCGSIAFSSRTPRESACFSVSPERCGSAP